MRLMPITRKLMNIITIIIFVSEHLLRSDIALAYLTNTYKVFSNAVKFYLTGVHNQNVDELR